MPTPWPQPWPESTNSAPDPDGAALQLAAQTGASPRADAAPAPRSRNANARTKERGTINGWRPPVREGSSGFSAQGSSLPKLQFILPGNGLPDAGRDRPAAAAVQGGEADRARRDGRDIPRDRHDARPGRCDQAARAAVRGRLGDPRALLARDPLR